MLQNLATKVYIYGTRCINELFKKRFEMKWRWNEMKQLIIGKEYKIKTRTSIYTGTLLKIDGSDFLFETIRGEELWLNDNEIMEAKNERNEMKGDGGNGSKEKYDSI